MEHTTSIVELNQVGFRYGTTEILDNINLTISKGDFVGLIGPNGSGKTTLVKLMLGLLAPQKGTVKLFGTEVSKFRDWNKVAYVAQKSGSDILQFPVTAEETVAMEGVSRKTATWALEAVEMANQAKSPISQLSGGQQQRVFIARALAKKPELLVLDEPTSGVDLESQNRFYELLKKLNREHKITLVLVSHDVDVVAHEVTQVVCVNKTIITHGKPQDVLKGDFLKKVYGENLRMVVHGH